MDETPTTPPYQIVPFEEAMTAMFGRAYPQAEPTLYSIASHLSDDYRGGVWVGVKLDDGAYFVRPDSRIRFLTCSDNGASEELTADDFGISVTLYALSNLSFALEGTSECDRVCDAFHALRNTAAARPEREAIFAIID